MNSNAENPLFSTVLGMCQMMLKKKAAEMGGFLKRPDIASVVDEILGMPSFAEVDREPLVAMLEERFTVITAEHQTLGNDDDHKAWLPARRGDITWRYWDRYLLFLEERVPRSAVDSIDKVANDVLARLEDPSRPGQWDRRGLVMGHVQSGKTANYCGLVCKAADAGYKVIIILAGIHNSLRSQTQIRLDEGFIGHMSETAGAGEQARRPAGVGLIDSSIHANTGTSRAELGDFNERVASQFGIHPGGLPLVFVVKKNVSVLNNLIRWVRSCADARDEATNRRYVRNVPALIVDDEADLASVDTRQQAFDENGQPDEDHDPTKTNKNIRLLLRSFEKVAYVGYTATPFANIYIHDKGRTPELGDDLFPRSFIVNIPAPSNYMGPARVFGVREDQDAGLEEVTSLPVVRIVSDHANSDEIDETTGWMPPKLLDVTGHIPRFDGKKAVPPSLLEAIYAFILATAARRLRSQGPLFNSMLIHVVRFTKVQREVATQVETALKAIHQRLRNGDGDRRPTIADELEALWIRDFVPTSARCAYILQTDLVLPDWADVLQTLENIVSGIQIKIINGSAGDILDYEEHRDTGMDLIAVGGDKLSRGLTLEGLTTSYFLRASRMYDTLMQMGRWFGYKEKYIDVCRLYTTGDLIEWFTHIAAASEELQHEFQHMVNVGGTPKDYGLKVRSHPAMLVTSSVKMKHGTEMRLSYSGAISETIIFSRDKVWVDANYEAVESWLRSLGPASGLGGKKGGYTWTTDVGTVSELMRAYKTHPDARRANIGLLSRYIKAQADNGELRDWTVRLASSGLGDATPHCIRGLDTGLIKRARFPEQQPKDRYIIRRLVSPTDELVDLTAEEAASALAITKAAWAADSRPSKPPDQPISPSGTAIRESRPKTRGLLILYPLDAVHAGYSDLVPVMGMAISFPKSETAREITYLVNNVFTNTGGDYDSL